MSKSIFMLCFAVIMLDTCMTFKRVPWVDEAASAATKPMG